MSAVRLFISRKVQNGAFINAAKRALRENCGSNLINRAVFVICAPTLRLLLGLAG